MRPDLEQSKAMEDCLLLPQAPQGRLAARPYVIAVTGHRDLCSTATRRFVRVAFGDLLQHLRQEHPEGVIALSGFAEGADTLFAEEALRLGLPLEGVIAYAGLIEDFAPGPSRERYLGLCARSRALHQLPFAARSVQAYAALGQRLVEACDLLIAAWDGRPPVDAGGTGGVVGYALSCGRPIIHIHTARHEIAALQT
jgi:hypothetical protein